MEINNIPDAFKTKLRIMILSCLITGSKSFSEIKKITGTTDGNLSVQLSNLENMGYISILKEFKGKKPLTTCSLTDLGRNMFKEYVLMLDRLLKNASDGCVDR